MLENLANLDTTDYTNPMINFIGQVLHRLPAALLTLLIGILIIRITMRIVKASLKVTKLQPAGRQVTGSVISALLWTALAVTMLVVLGFSNVIVFFTGSAVALGLILNAGGSTFMSDIFAGVFLAGDRDFSIGDEVQIGDPVVHGVIERLDTRRTRVRDANGKLHVIPNSVVERNEWVVMYRKRDLPKPTPGMKATEKFKTVVKSTAKKKS